MRAHIRKRAGAIALLMAAPLVTVVGAGVGSVHATPTTTVTRTSPNTAGQSGTTAGVAGDHSTGFDSGSIAALAAPAGGKSEFYWDAATLFGRDDVTLGEISTISYSTKTGATHTVDPRDWFLVIYTENYTGDVSSATWYGDRINAEPYFSENLSDPASTWNTWSTDGANNQLRFFESTSGYFGSYTDQHWSAFKSGNALSGQSYASRELGLFSIQTGSSWAAGFTGQFDGVTITLTDGSVAKINLEPNTPDCTTVCYVNGSTGNDLNGGASADDAKKTIQAGIDAVTAGGTVNVAAGSYAHALTIGKALTLDGAGVASTTVEGTTDTGNGITIASNTSGVNVSDLTVQNFDDGIYMVGASFSDTTFTDVASLSNGTHGFFIGGGGSTQTNLSFTRVNSSNNGGPGSGGRGIYMTDGVKANISIVDGTYDNNALVGVDMNDGSVTGLTISGNTVSGNGDSGIGVLGAQGPGANLVSGNTVSNNGRYGIEIKVPNGSGATSGAASVVISGNTVTRTVAATDARDYAGIAVFRRSGNPTVNADQPVGVVVSGNTVNGFHRATVSTGDGFGIVVEGTNHTVTHNIVSNNDVGIQIQAGNAADVQSTPAFDRGNASGASALINRNSITGNTVQLRNVGAPTTDATCNWFGSAAGPGTVTGFTTAPWLKTSNLDGTCGVTVTVSASPSTVTEGGTAGFNIKLSENPSAPVTVSYTTVDGTATTSSAAIGGSDYSFRSGAVTFNPGGSLTQTVGVPTRNDSTDENNETFQLQLTGATNGNLANNTATKTIVDNDNAPKITIGDASVVEGNPTSGNTTKSISFTVKLSTVSAKNVSATYKTRNGTGSTGAVGGPTSGDFVSVNSTTITIPAGSTQATIVITVRKDRTKEKNEQFFIDLSNLQNTVLGDGSAKGTITNDD